MSMSKIDYAKVLSVIQEQVEQIAHSLPTGEYLKASADLYVYKLRPLLKRVNNLASDDYLPQEAALHAFLRAAKDLASDLAAPPLPEVNSRSDLEAQEAKYMRAYGGGA